ncbi:VOC family protein [Hufsiella ginkgonis]|uniref:VOC family protein n=1 Tax=Hufsiella ginkgonis TaxID=2695274 RepID=A0A7K1Y232_9SPHI|nr:VOC family protein [Hufsiella ginkgonis]MXV17079.1 VOC family protein [Hufsiella ginkgonis]
MEIPKGHQSVMPYLMLNNATGFIDFTGKVFGAIVINEVKRDDQTTYMHAEVEISGSTIMFCDASDDWPPVPASLFVYVENADHSYESALANGAVSIMGLSDQNYGRTCGVTDPFGNTWWITSVAAG